MLLIVGNSSGCIVLAINRFCDDGAIATDERLVGTWKDSDDNIEVAIEASDWRSYRLSFTHPVQKGVLTAYLFKSGDAQYLDLTSARGEDPGTFVVAAHTVVRVSFDASAMTVTPLSHPWFLAAQANGGATQLVPERSDRDQVVLAAPAKTLQAWLAGISATDPAWGTAATFRKQP